MKRLITWALTMAIIATACNKKTEIYSCNPELSKWVVENKATYANTDRATLCKLRSDSMIVMLHSIEPSVKVNLWKEKMALVMQQNFTREEKQHLEKLFAQYRVEIYTDSVINKAFNLFAEQWWKEANERLNWDNKKIFMLTNTLYTEDEFVVHDVLRIIKDGSSQKAEHITIPYKDPDCTCRYSLSCTNGSCIDGACGYQPADCGVFGGSRCTGSCQ
jgi:hypothetical protein